MTAQGHAWWYLARATGWVAWGLIAASVIAGLALSGRVTRGRPTKPWLLDIHRFLGATAIAFTGFHLLGLIADSYVHFGAREVLVPLTSSWHPLAVALGVVALYLLAAVEISSLLMRHIPRKVWRAIHLTSFVLFWLVTFHLLLAGTDAGNRLARGVVDGTIVVVVIFTLVRVLNPPATRRASVRTIGVAAALTMLALAAGGFARYHRQISSYATHRIGGPAATSPLAPLVAKETPLLRIAAAGDVGDAGPAEDRTAAAIAAEDHIAPYDVLMLLGDNVYPAGDPAQIPNTVFRPFAPLLDHGADLVAVLGNHDDMKGHGDAQLAALGMPGRWYSERRSDVLLVALDSTEPTSPQQRAWLEHTLSASDARWKIVALHHPPYSSGYHGSSKPVRDAFAPLFERYGVQLVLAGHDHDYQRSRPINGVTYVVSGAASETRRTGRASFTAAAYSTHHYVDLTIYSDRLLLRAINQHGRQFDTATISRTAGLPTGTQR